MGYFSNGTEGMQYEDQYCSKCAHCGDCAVWDLHMLHNYDEANKDDSFLHKLIPLDEKKIHNLKCKMFLNSTNQGTGEHICSLCKSSFDEYQELMFHYGECEG